MTSHGTQRTCVHVLWSRWQASGPMPSRPAARRGGLAATCSSIADCAARARMCNLPQPSAASSLAWGTGTALAVSGLSRTAEVRQISQPCCYSPPAPAQFTCSSRELWPLAACSTLRTSPRPPQRQPLPSQPALSASRYGSSIPPAATAARPYPRPRFRHASVPATHHSVTHTPL
jgi:hypothetical protein